MAYTPASARGRHTGRAAQRPSVRGFPVVHARHPTHHVRHALRAEDGPASQAQPTSSERPTRGRGVCARRDHHQSLSQQSLAVTVSLFLSRLGPRLVSSSLFCSSSSLKPPRLRLRLRPEPPPPPPPPRLEVVVVNVAWGGAASSLRVRNHAARGWWLWGLSPVRARGPDSAVCSAGEGGRRGVLGGWREGRLGGGAREEGGVGGGGGFACVHGHGHGGG